MIDRTRTVFTVITSPRKAVKVKLMLKRQNRLAYFIPYRNKRDDREYYIFYFAFK